MALLIYSGILLITGVQIKAFNEASDEVLSTWSPSGEPRGAGGRRAARAVYSYSPVMKCLYAAAWSTGGKNRLEMMSSSKSFLALSFRRMLPSSHATPSAKAPDLLSWTNASFMTLLLFYHGNSFESIYQSAGTIRHVDLKDQVQVIPSIHWGGPRWKVKKGEKKIPSPPTSTVCYKRRCSENKLLSSLTCDEEKPLIVV